MFYRLNLNRTESMVFNSIQLFYIKVDKLIVREVNIITFIDVKNINTFKCAEDLDD